MKKIILATVLPAVILVSGCQSTTKYVDSGNESIAVLGLSQRDFDQAANQALNDIIASPLLVHPEADKGGRYILSIYNIINDTSQRIDTDQLVKKIRVGLLQSGKFLTTTAVNFTGSGPEDTSSTKVRELNDSALINKNTVKKNGTVISPDFSLSGKIIQRTNRVNRSEQLVEYYFQLTLTQLETGLAYWEGEYPIAKTGSNDSVTW
ncbi:MULTISPECIES: penicillin-binding protein activator LpoB [unclassified Pseudoalteromonas]|uniref:penicillin-binding protein activator LpoB n=1 Tax=unclassified Pseudoalteromonas TaxID=194690 RepID=UPI001FB1A726|nr:MULTISPECIES: penicillin-binding protein activator LpoB [unclassified Pseudoalteromonas]UOB72290.1 penicillin-binding protein activator LpoB [Pseudoalteromonas sp. APM04]